MQLARPAFSGIFLNHLPRDGGVVPGGVLDNGGARGVQPARLNF